MQNRIKSLSRRKLLGTGGAVLCASALPLPLRAETYPTRPIRVIQGFAPGGNADTIARLVGGEMAKGLGQSVVVESQTGAGGTLAAAAVARADPDGYTMLIAPGGHSVVDALYKSLPFDPVESFQMVSTITFFPFLIVVREDSPYQNLQQLLDAARSSKESIAYGTAGPGTLHHLGGEMLMRMADVNLLHVPYRGDAASVLALLAGDVPFIISTVTGVLGSLQAGKVRVLAATGPQRWPGLPDVPTVAEQGVAGFDIRSWMAWMLPAGVPADIVERLRAETERAVQVPAVQQRLQEMGGEARASTPEEMATMVAAEVKRWTGVVEAAGIPKI